MSSLPPSSAMTVTGHPFQEEVQEADPTPQQTLAYIEQLFGIEDEEAFMQNAVAVAAAITGSNMALLYVREGDMLITKAVATPEGGTSSFTGQQRIDLIAVTAVNQQASQRATVTVEHQRYLVLCVPFSTATDPSMALAILLAADRMHYADAAFTVLHLVTQLFQRRAIYGQTAYLQSGFDRATILIDLFTRTSKANEFREAVTIICDEMRDLTGCMRVAIGIGTSAGVKIYGMSGSGGVEHGSHSTALLAAAMRESIGVKSNTIWPERRDILKALTPASQEQLLQTLTAGEVLTVPLRPTPKADAIGAWCFLWSPDTTFTLREVELIEAATPHVTALLELCRESQPRGIYGAVRRFRKTASKFKKTAAFMIPLIALVAMAIPVPNRIGADCRLQPTRARQVAAPFQGLLERTYVKPGDVVEQGQVLAELDGKEVRWRLAEASARREGKLKERDQALADRNVSATQLAQRQADSLTLEVELLKYQRDNLEIKAPIAGTILSGNLERSEGVPVQTGQKLFDLAPIEQLELEISVPDAEVSRVRAGQTVYFRLESQTSFGYKSELAEVYPISELYNDRNVFVCLAMVDNTAGQLRPGMRGKARISADARPLGWILFHRLWDFFRLQAW